MDENTDSNDPVFYIASDPSGRRIATFRSTDANPKETFVYHLPGSRGPALWGGGLLLRDRNASLSDPTKWATETAGVDRAERVYQCADYKGDIVALVKATGNTYRGELLEQDRYSPSGVPFGMPVGDLNADGVVDATDSSIQTTIASGSYQARADVNLDGKVDSTDAAVITAASGNQLARMKLSLASTRSSVGTRAAVHYLGGKRGSTSRGTENVLYAAAAVVGRKTIPGIDTAPSRYPSLSELPAVANRLRVADGNKKIPPGIDDDSGDTKIVNIYKDGDCYVVETETTTYRPKLDDPGPNPSASYRTTGFRSSYTGWTRWRDVHTAEIYPISSDSSISLYGAASILNYLTTPLSDDMNGGSTAISHSGFNIKCNKYGTPRVQNPTTSGPATVTSAVQNPPGASGLLYAELSLGITMSPTAPYYDSGDGLMHVAAIGDYRTVWALAALVSISGSFKWSGIGLTGAGNITMDSGTLFAGMWSWHCEQQVNRNKNYVCPEIHDVPSLR